MTPLRHGSRVGLHGSRIGANTLGAAAAETIGTFVLIYGGTAVAVAALLARPVAGPGYDSLAIVWERAPVHVRLEHGRSCLLELEKQRVI